MDRHRGSSSGYRNSSTSHYSSSDYTSRNFEHNQQNRRGRGGNSSHHGWSGEKNSYSAPKDYDRYSSDKGIFFVNLFSKFNGLITLNFCT